MMPLYFTDLFFNKMNHNTNPKVKVNLKMKRLSLLIFLISIFITTNLVSQDMKEENIYQLLYSGQTNQVIDLLNEEIKLDSTNAELYFLMGMTHSLQNHFREALDYFEKSYQLNPGHVNNLNYYANTLSKMGYDEQAETKYREAVQLDSARIDIMDSLGKLHYSNSEFSDAHEIYSELIRIYPTDGYYALMLARCAVKMDSIDKADQYYQMAYQADPQNIKTILEYAQNWVKMDSLNQALVLLEDGLLLDKSNRNLNRLKAEILYKQEKYTLATLSFLDAIAYGDRSIEVLKKLGYCYFANQKYQDSREIFTQSLILNNIDPVVYFYLGMCSKQLEDYNEAIFFFEMALATIYPDYLDNLYIQLAECCHNEQQFTQAIQYLRKALEYTSEKEIVYYTLANVYDDYYADKNVPLIYYKKALQKEISPGITEFIHQKIETLTEELFFK
ncbi:tetratricopeptide repeat protein [bacterium]|nr:tetratricopeptide repeat protein [bacterium]